MTIRDSLTGSNKGARENGLAEGSVWYVCSNNWACFDAFSIQPSPPPTISCPSCGYVQEDEYDTTFAQVSEKVGYKFHEEYEKRKRAGSLIQQGLTKQVDDVIARKFEEYGRSIYHLSSGINYISFTMENRAYSDFIPCIVKGLTETQKATISDKITKEYSVEEIDRCLLLLQLLNADTLKMFENIIEAIKEEMIDIPDHGREDEPRDSSDKALADSFYKIYLPESIDTAFVRPSNEENIKYKEKVVNDYASRTENERAQWVDHLSRVGLLEIYDSDNYSIIRGQFLFEHPEYKYKFSTIQYEDRSSKLRPEHRRIFTLVEQREKLNILWLSEVDREENDTGGSLSSERWTETWDKISTAAGWSSDQERGEAAIKPSDPSQLSREQTGPDSGSSGLVKEEPGKGTQSTRSREIRFCPMCGAKQQVADARFCYSCGERLKET